MMRSWLLNLPLQCTKSYKLWSVGINCCRVRDWIMFCIHQLFITMVSFLLASVQLSLQKASLLASFFKYTFTCVIPWSYTCFASNSIFFALSMFLLYHWRVTKLVSFAICSTSFFDCSYNEFQWQSYSRYHRACNTTMELYI